MPDLDPRRNAFRPDLADLALKDQVAAARYVAGAVLEVTASQAPLRRAPSDEAALDTEALCGERVRVFETNADGWCWAKLAADGYVGWMPRAALAKPGRARTHRVSVLRTLVFAEPDIKSPPLASLPLGAMVAVVGETEDANARYAMIEPAGAIVVQHLAPRGEASESDWTAVAVLFTGTPYLWGGKTGLGIDCSGLVQIALQTCGIACPRDSDMQESELGHAVSIAEGLPALRRGDLVFWKGHVGFMRDAETLLHANAHHMAVASEPLQAAVARFQRRGLQPSAVRRVAPR